MVLDYCTLPRVLLLLGMPSIFNVCFNVEFSGYVTINLQITVHVEQCSKQFEDQCFCIGHMACCQNSKSQSIECHRVHVGLFYFPFKALYNLAPDSIRIHPAKCTFSSSSN